MTAAKRPVIRIGCQANAWEREAPLRERRPEHFAETLRQLAVAGYEGVELPAWTIPDLDQPPAVRELLERYSLALAAVHVAGVFWDRASFTDGVLPLARQAGACAAGAGAENVLVSAFPKRSAGQAGAVRKTADELRLQAYHLGEVARLNQELGLRTFYHNHYEEFLHGEEELQSILAIDPSLLNLAFDTANAARALPGDALVDAMGRHWARTGYLHFKDMAGTILVEALGDGEIDFDAIGVLIRERGFSGWVVAEIEPAPGMVTNRTVLEDAGLSCAFIRSTLGRTAASP